MDINDTDYIYKLGKLVGHLETVANKECLADRLEEDDVIYDFVGSNVDDAYEGGVESGKIQFARELLAMLG